MEADVIIMKFLLLLFAMSFFSTTEGLKCWLCISNCEGNPFDNHRATPKDCQKGESCQKTEYRGRDSGSREEYASVTRSCSQGQCHSHMDNCTDDRLSNPGCMIRHCCNETNFCNGSPPSFQARVLLPHGMVLPVAVVVWLLQKTR